MRSVLKITPIAGQCTSPGSAGCVDGFPCQLPSAGACELERWRPSAVNCLRGASPAWRTENPQAPTSNAESPKEMKQAEEFFDPEKEWNELHEGTEAKKTPGQAWAWTTLRKPYHKNKTLEKMHAETAILGKTNKDDD